jgi:hypothetical protein
MQYHCSIYVTVPNVAKATDSFTLLLLQQQAHAGPSDVQHTDVWSYVLQVKHKQHAAADVLMLV